jgi:hypothetical protein
VIEQREGDRAGDEDSDTCSGVDDGLRAITGGTSDAL